MASTRTREIRGRVFVDVVLTAAEHDALVEDGDDLRRVCSLAGSERIGLGGFVENEAGEWVTSFPADLGIGKRPAVGVEQGEAEAAKLAEMVGWAADRANRAKVRAIVADVALAREIDRTEAETGEPDPRVRPDVSDERLRERFATARGVVSESVRR